MSAFQVGFSRGDITPPVGACLAGSIDRRVSIGVCDPLLSTVLAFSDGEKRVLLICLDCLCECMGGDLLHCI